MNVYGHFNPVSTLVLKNKDVLFALKIDIRLKRLGTSCDPGSAFWGIGWGVGMAGQEETLVSALPGQQEGLRICFRLPTRRSLLRCLSGTFWCFYPASQQWKRRLPSLCSRSMSALKPVASVSSDLPLGSFSSKSFSLSLPESGPGIFTF